MVWLREYSIPLAVTLVLHFVLLMWLASDFSGKPKQFEIKEPKFIKANLVKLKPKTVKKKKKVKQKPKTQPKKKPAAKRKKDKSQQQTIIFGQPPRKRRK